MFAKILNKELCGCPVILLAAIVALVGAILCVCGNGIVACASFEPPAMATDTRPAPTDKIFGELVCQTLQVYVGGSSTQTGYLRICDDRVYNYRLLLLRDLTYSDLVHTLEGVLKALPADHSRSVSLTSDGDSDTVAIDMVEQALRDAGFKSISRS
jgi:hypothetical protein